MLGLLRAAEVQRPPAAASPEGEFSPPKRDRSKLPAVRSRSPAVERGVQKCRRGTVSSLKLRSGPVQTALLISLVSAVTSGQSEGLLLAGSRGELSGRSSDTPAGMPSALLALTKQDDEDEDAGPLPGDGVIPFGNGQRRRMPVRGQRNGYLGVLQ